MSNEDHPDIYEIHNYMDGKAKPDVARHVKSCPNCLAVVDEYTQKREAFLARSPTPEEFAKRIVQMAARQEAEERMRRYRLSARLGWGAAVAAAAGLAAVLLAPGSLWPPPPQAGVRSHGPELQHRGASSKFTAVRIRGGRKSRHVDSVSVRDGDKLYVEVHLDKAARLSAGLLQDDGTWSDLFEDRHIEAGTYPVNRAKVLTPSRHADPGWLLVGPPSLVKEALAERRTDIDGLTAIRVMSGERGPLGAPRADGGARDKAGLRGDR